MQRQDRRGLHLPPTLFPGDGSNQEAAAVVAIHLLEPRLPSFGLLIANVVAENVRQPGQGVLSEAWEWSIEIVVKGLGERLQKLVLVPVDTDLVRVILPLTHGLSLPEGDTGRQE
jgi:hypothetical protein